MIAAYSCNDRQWRLLFIHKYMKIITENSEALKYSVFLNLVEIEFIKNKRERETEFDRKKFWCIKKHFSISQILIRFDCERKKMNSKKSGRIQLILFHG